MLAATAACLFWLVLRGLSLRVVLSLGAMVVAGFVLLSASGVTEASSPLERFMTVTSVEEKAAGTGGSLYTRFEGYSRAWERIQERPLIGVGFDSESGLQELEGPHAVHNMIFNSWFSGGALSLVGILFLVGGVLACGVGVLRRTPVDERSAVASLVAALVAFVLFGMGEPILFVRYGWLPSALLIALRAQQLRRDRIRSVADGRTVLR
jgi:O-antigen ligase